MYNTAMKYRYFALILPLLASCSFSFPNIRNSDTGSSLDSQSMSEKDGSSESVDASRDSENGGGSSSSITEGSDEPNEEKTLDVYAINDFHGQIKEEGSYPGVESVATYLKKRGEKENTLLISSGDMFQGALESNYNNGNLLADIMNDCKFDALSLGNHDFDWGLETLKENKDRVSSDGYQTPYLCANLYNYESGEEGDEQLSQYGAEYTISEQENGLKVGIIGAIGEDQYTSITSTYVKDVCFKDPSPIVKELSDELRTEKDCDVVILSFHAPQDAMLGKGVTNVSPISGKRYVDLVLCAHTHMLESTTENGVIFTQNNDKGENASHVTLKVDSEGEVTSKLETVEGSVMKEEAKSSGYDESISDLVSAYGEKSEGIGEEILGNVSGYFTKKESLPNLVAQALLEEASEAFDNVDLAMVNSGRENLSSGSLTYGELFSALPFDNEVYLIETSGTALLNEAKYNCVARAQEEAFDSSTTYQIAVIDYLAVHQNKNHVYDYFPGAKILGKVTSGASAKRGYRDITADYIRSKGTINSTNYSSSLDRHNTKKLTSSVSL